MSFSLSGGPIDTSAPVYLRVIAKENFTPSDPSLWLVVLNGGPDTRPSQSGPFTTSIAVPGLPMQYPFNTTPTKASFLIGENGAVQGMSVVPGVFSCAMLCYGETGAKTSVQLIDVETGASTNLAYGKPMIMQGSDGNTFKLVGYGGTVNTLCSSVSSGTSASDVYFVAYPSIPYKCNGTACVQLPVSLQGLSQPQWQNDIAAMFPYDFSTMAKILTQYSPSGCTAICDPSKNCPCKNNQTCKPDGTCNCTGCYSGTLCDSVCNNNGTCSNDGTCECYSGDPSNKCYKPPVPCDPPCTAGRHCEDGACVCDTCYDTNAAGDCVKIDCQNGGSCNPATGKCQCVGGYTGDNCEASPSKKLSKTTIIILASVGSAILLFVIIFLAVRYGRSGREAAIAAQEQQDEAQSEF